MEPSGAGVREELATGPDEEGFNMDFGASAIIWAIGGSLIFGSCEKGQQTRLQVDLSGQGRLWKRPFVGNMVDCVTLVLSLEIAAPRGSVLLLLRSTVTEASQECSVHGKGDMFCRVRWEIG